MFRALAGAGLAAAVAGCGAASQSPGAATSTAPNGVGSAVAPAPAVGAGAGVVAQGSSGAAQRANQAAGKLIHQQPQPRLTQAAGSHLTGQVPGISQGSGGTAHGVSPARPSAPVAGSGTGAATRTTPTTPAGAGTSGGTGTGLPVRTVVRVEKITVRVPFRPDAPLTAFMLSKHPALAQKAFLVTGGNVGCALRAGQVLCSVHRRVWTPPPQPANCSNGWGETIALSGHGPARFVCGFRSAIVPAAKVIPNGWDDRMGNITCEVRSIGVDCFSKAHHGMTLSRTGYAIY